MVTFPYFAPHVQQRFAGLSTGMAGLLFGLPHAVYLLAVLPLTRWLACSRRAASSVSRRLKDRGRSEP